MVCLGSVFLTSWLLQPAISSQSHPLTCLNGIASTDALLIADPEGQILYKKNETKKCIPASTLKLLTALAAIHHLGPSYRFRTEFYMDRAQNLKIKGYGDPLLISEAWHGIADVLAKKVHEFGGLILDDTYFFRNITIPGCGNSINPYDAPVGALCANFNTVYFDRDQQGRIISAEPHTPMLPYARKKIQSLGQKRGRYTFSHDQRDATRYAGKLLLHFLKQKGVVCKEGVRLGSVQIGDRLIYTYHSEFTMEQALQKMMEFSNNFMANQILVALGAHVYGPPGTLAKGVKAISSYAKKELNLQDIQIAEGSGISRKNRVSATDMQAILKRFKPYRHLLKQEDNVIYKTGTLKDISTRVGYIEINGDEPYYFVIFLNRRGSDIDSLMECIKWYVAEIWKLKKPLL